MLLSRMFLSLLLALVGALFFYVAVKQGWQGPGHEGWRWLFLPGAGLLLGAWIVWPR
jgi:hypothetical protein